MNFSIEVMNWCFYFLPFSTKKMSISTSNKDFLKKKKGIHFKIKTFVLFIQCLQMSLHTPVVFIILRFVSITGHCFQQFWGRWIRINVGTEHWQALYTAYSSCNLKFITKRNFRIIEIYLYAIYQKVVHFYFILLYKLIFQKWNLLLC